MSRLGNSAMPECCLLCEEAITLSTLTHKHETEMMQPAE